jgi:hypothetical protein
MLALIRHMNYELAKELEEAGFQQGGEGSWTFPPEKLVSRQADRVYIPTLSELIEACGNVDLEVRTGHSCAGQLVKMDIVKGQGSTPEEAVARLWLALNKKV